MINSSFSQDVSDEVSLFASFLLWLLPFFSFPILCLSDPSFSLSGPDHMDFFFPPFGVEHFPSL